MQKEQLQDYAKPAETLLRMFADRQYYERKYQALGYRAVTVLEHEAQGQSFRIKVRFQAEAKLPLPAIARRFVSGTQTIVQEDRWDFAQRKGQLLIDIQGLPIKVSAATHLRDTPHGAVNVLNWDVRCAVPLIGTKLEEVMLAELWARAVADLEASQKLVADY